MDIIISRFTPTQARIVTDWKYPPPYEIYSSSPLLVDELLLDEGDGLGYFVVTLNSSSRPLGYCCYGPEATVRGEPGPRPATLDLGGGVAPESVSEGFASQYLPRVMEHGTELHHPLWFRVAVAAFNERSLALCRSAGFFHQSFFNGPSNRVFLELYRSADRE